MSLSDPFQSTYEGSRQALGSFGEALTQTAKTIAERKQKQAELEQEYALKGRLEQEKESRDRVQSEAMMKQFGLMFPSQTSGQPQAMGQSPQITQPAVGGPMVGQPTKKPLPNQYIYVPTPSIDASGRVSMSVSAKENPEYATAIKQQEEQQKQDIKTAAKSGEATKKATGNFGRVAGAVKQYSDYYAKAIDEGGAGGLLAREKGKIVTQQLGGSIGEQMQNTGKLYGQRAELSLSMVPILTNQNRFMTSIMDYINQSLPQGHEGAGLAKSKLEQTLLNQFTTTKVLTRLGYNPDNPDDVKKIDDMNDGDAGALAREVISMSQSYKLSESDKKEFDLIQKDILGSLNKKAGSRQTSSDTKAELDAINKRLAELGG